jgi:hypothetical protein
VRTYSVYGEPHLGAFSMDLRGRSCFPEKTPSSYVG